MPSIKTNPRFDGSVFRGARSARIADSVIKSILLIFSLLLSTFSPFEAKSQISNELAYDSLILSKSPLVAPGFSFVTGIITPGLQNGLRIDTSFAQGVELLPEVKWAPLSGDSIERSIEVKMIFSDSLHTEVLLQRKDTLQVSQLREARKTSYRQLRGDNPRFVPRILVPAATIVTGVVVIISLFYVRSI